MGWRLLKWLWATTPTAFVLAGREATVFFRAPNDTVQFAMSTEEISQFGTSHDPDDESSRNIDIGGLLRRVGGSYDDVDVFLDLSNTDSALVLSVIAYDAVKQKVSWRQTGGAKTNRALDSDGVTMRLGYRIVVRVFLTDGRHYDQSVFQLIDDH